MVVSHAPSSIHYAAATAAMNAMWSAERGATGVMTEACLVVFQPWHHLFSDLKRDLFSASKKCQKKLGFWIVKDIPSCWMSVNPLNGSPVELRRGPAGTKMTFCQVGETTWNRSVYTMVCYMCR